MTAGPALQTLILDLSERMAAIERQHAAAADPPLAPPEMAALRLLAQKGPVRMRDLASSLGLPPSSVTGLADRLEGRALAERRRVPGDRRTVHLDLAPQGRTLIEAVRAEQAVVCDRLVESFGPAEAAVLRLLTRRFQSTPSEQGDDP